MRENKVFPFEAVALDLDGTLLDENHEMPPANGQIIDVLYDKGVRIIIASGRMTDTIYRVCSPLRAPYSIIAYNGCKLLTPNANGWETEFDVTLDKTICRRVYQLCERLGLFLNVYCREKLSGYQPAGQFSPSELYKAQTGSVYEGFTNDIKTLPETKVTKLLCITDPKNRDALYETLAKEMGSECQVIKSQPEYVEFTPPGITKGWALQKWCGKFSINIQSIFAMGDADNDLEMLQIAGRGMAVANASDGLKKKFANISPWTNQELSVFKELNAIFHLNLSEK